MVLGPTPSASALKPGATAWSPEPSVRPAGLTPAGTVPLGPHGPYLTLYPVPW